MDDINEQKKFAFATFSFSIFGNNISPVINYSNCLKCLKRTVLLLSCNNQQLVTSNSTQHFAHNCMRLLCSILLSTHLQTHTHMLTRYIIHKLSVSIRILHSNILSSVFPIKKQQSGVQLNNGFPKVECIKYVFTFASCSCWMCMCNHNVALHFDFSFVFFVRRLREIVTIL